MELLRFVSIFAWVAIVHGGPANGKQTTKTRDLASFTHIFVWDLNDDFNVHYIKGNVNNVRLAGEAKIVDALKTEVVVGFSGVLTLNVSMGNSGSFKPIKPINVYITSVKLTAAILGEQASCYFTTDKMVQCDETMEIYKLGKGNMAWNVNAPELNVYFRSMAKGEIVALGEVKTLYIETERNTKSAFKGLLLKASEATVSNKGNSEIVLNVSDKLAIYSGKSAVRNVGKARIMKS